MITIYFTLDENGFVNSRGSTPSHSENEHILELPKEHDFFSSDIHSWKYENNELIFDEERNEQRKEEAERQQNKMTKEEINEMAILELASIVANMIGDD